jgi:hypothetical protein
MRNRVAPAACTLAGHTAPSGRTRRRRPLICALALGALAALPAPAGADPSATLDVVADGNGAVTISPSPPDGAGVCLGSLDALGECAYRMRGGEQVTLTAAPNADAALVDPPTTFVGWSDARCPGAGPCTLTMDDEPMTVTALFSPQHVTVDSVGPGTVTASTGATCVSTTEGPRTFLDCGRFPILSQLTLQANPSTPEVDVTWEPSTCDAPAPMPGDLRCTLTVLGPIEGQVGFGDEPGGASAPTIGVSFRVFKQGSGSGTVRGRALDCGSRCVSRGNFGDRETLVADPAPGSRFAGWRGVCARAPRCSFATGPVTSAVAVFDRADAPSTGPGASVRRPGAGAAPPGARHAAFAARLERVTVTGHGRRRQVRIRVRLDAPGTVRAALLRRGHRAARGRWRVPAGAPLLRLRVPPATRSGRYRLAVSFRDGSGHATRDTKRVWLPR